MKSQWLYEEVFKANEYIAACITGVIQDIYIEIADYEKNMPFTDGFIALNGRF